MLHIRILTALILFLIIQPLRASALAIVGGSTMMDITSADALIANGISWSPLGPASLSSVNGKELLFMPITGGTFTPGPTFMHDGGLRLSRGSNFVEISSLVFDLPNRNAQGSISLNGSSREITFFLHDCSRQGGFENCFAGDSLLLSGWGMALSSSDRADIREALQLDEGLAVLHLAVAHPEIELPEASLTWMTLGLIVSLALRHRGLSQQE